MNRKFFLKCNEFLGRGSKNRGFTLVELMVVSAIIIILSVYVSANYHQGNRELALEMAAGKFAQNLRRVQEWAYSAHQIDGASYIGYGIYITDNSTAYSIYTDDSGNGRYTSSVDEEREAIYLDNDFEVDNIKPCGPSESCAALSSVSVNFVPPDPGTIISDSGGTQYDKATITLKISGTTTYRSVVVNRAGLIYVK